MRIIPLCPRMAALAADSSPVAGPPLIIVEGPAARRAVLAELAGAGWVLDGPAPTGIRTFTVASASDAEAVVLAALRAEALLISIAPRDELPAILVEVVDDLLDDLSAVGPVRHITGDSVVTIDVDGWQLAHGLAAGATVEALARQFHLSPRTAHRRIRAARRALGAASRAQLVRALASPDRIPPVSDR